MKTLYEFWFLDRWYRVVERSKTWVQQQITDEDQPVLVVQRYGKTGWDTLSPFVATDILTKQALKLEDQVIEVRCSLPDDGAR